MKTQAVQERIGHQSYFIGGVEFGVDEMESCLPGFFDPLSIIESKIEKQKELPVY